MGKNKEKRKIPKNEELVSVLATHLDSELNVGDSRNMTPLAKEIDLNGSSPHVDTVRNKLSEGFIFKDVLKNFKPTYENGKLIRIEKIKQTESNSDMVMPILVNINSKVEKMQKDIEKLNIKK